MSNPLLSPPDVYWGYEAGTTYRPSWSSHTGYLNLEHAEIWQATCALPGARTAADCEKLYEMAYHSGAIILEIGTLAGRGSLVSLRGALHAYTERRIPCPQLYSLETDPEAIRRSYLTLQQAGLTDYSLLYHGNLIRFRREIPITPTMVFVDGDPRYAGVWADLHELHTFLAPGTPVLCQQYDENPDVRRAVNEWVEAGFYEWMGLHGSAALLRASRRCSGHVQGLELEHFKRLSRIQLGRYLKADTEALAPDYQATRLARLQGPSRWIERGTCGLGPWPYARPETLPLPPTLPDGSPWPRISIVTASYNQGKYIEQTILSVAHQGYPNVEHIVMDGGSTDTTLAILERHRHRLAYVVSEKDNGQCDAINKGFRRATGEIVTWLNSDDMLAPGAMAAVALAFHTSGADMVAGVCQLLAEGRINDQHLTSCGDGLLPLDDLLHVDNCWNAGQFFYQPEVLFTRALWDKAGGRLNEELYFSLDYELWLRFAEQGARLHVVGRPVAIYRQHPEQKTYVFERFQSELRKVRDDFLSRTGRPWARERHLRTRKSRLRMVFFNDVGDRFGAGTAHGRLAQAAATAGHDVEVHAVTPVHSIYTTPLATNEAILGRLEQTAPDVVVLGNLHGSSLDPCTLGLIAERWPTLFVLHDVWAVTGRCAYTAGCEKYRTGCDHTCPTPQEYPRLEPEQIHNAWAAKRRILFGPRPPVLLGDSEWTTRFARQALQATAPDSALPPMGAIRYGFPMDVFQPRDKRLCREMLDLPQDRFIILTSGTTVAEPRKGIQHLATALRGLQLPDVLVVAVGHLKEGQTPPIPGMRALGYIEDPRRLALLYSAVDLFVGPSLEEAFGQVFVEAAACGTPSIGYPVGGVPEAVVDGVTGRIAAAVDPDALAAAIEELYAHPQLRRHLGGWGRLYVENEYSMARAYHRLITVLAELGVRDRLNLVPKIALRLAPPQLPPTSYIDGNFPCWRTLSGFSEWEGPPLGLGLPRVCQAYGPVSRLTIHAERPARHVLLIACTNVQEGQRLRLLHNGSLLAEQSIPCRGPDHEIVLHLEVDMVQEANTFEMHHWQWDHSRADRPIALTLHSIRHAALDGLGSCASSRGGAIPRPPNHSADSFPNRHDCYPTHSIGERMPHEDVMVKTLVFDFGNVIGFFDHRLVTDRLAPHAGIPADALHTYLWDSPIEDDYESGRISTEEFLRQVCATCRLRCSDAELAAAYEDIFWPNPDVIALLPRLKPGYRLLLASNTNDLHARKFLKQFAEPLQAFDALVLSHEAGARKPRAEFFAQCQRLAGCAPRECLFIDDLPANIRGAREHGWQGIVYTSFMDLYERLKALGIRA